MVFTQSTKIQSINLREVKVKQSLLYLCSGVFSSLASDFNLSFLMSFHVLSGRTLFHFNPQTKLCIHYTMFSIGRALSKKNPFPKKNPTFKKNPSQNASPPYPQSAIMVHKGFFLGTSWFTTFL